MFFDGQNNILMSFFSGREKAASPTPSLNNVETVSFDEIDEEGNTSVKLGYHPHLTEEQIQEEKRKSEFPRTALPREREACQLGFFSIVWSVRFACH